MLIVLSTFFLFLMSQFDFYTFSVTCLLGLLGFLVWNVLKNYFYPTFNSQDEDPMANVKGSKIYNGITAGEEFSRDKLMNTVVKYINDKKEVIILSSPRASGKSSFLQLFRRDRPVNAIYRYVKMDKKKKLNGLEQLKMKAKISFNESEDTWRFPPEMKNGRVIVIIDDAQEMYDDPMWSTLLKSGGNSLPSNFVLLIACTHLLSGGDSPVEFHSCSSRIGFSEFLLSKEESHRLVLDPRIGLNTPLKDYETLREMIVNDCNGHIGSLRMTIDELNEININTPLKDEHQAISSYFNIAVPQLYKRCWSFNFRDVHWDEVIEKYVVALLANDFLTVEIGEGDKRLKRLLKAGILRRNEETQSLQFSSQLAKRFFCEKYYTDRASSHEFKNLQELAVKCVEVMPAHVLAQSVVEQKMLKSKEPDFPKEATLQHLFTKSSRCRASKFFLNWPKHFHLLRMNPPKRLKAKSTST